MMAISSPPATLSDSIVANPGLLRTSNRAVPASSEIVKRSGHQLPDIAYRTDAVLCVGPGWLRMLAPARSLRSDQPVNCVVQARDLSITGTLRAPGLTALAVPRAGEKQAGGRVTGKRNPMGRGVSRGQLARQGRRLSAAPALLGHSGAAGRLTRSAKIGTCREDGKHRSPLGSLPPDESGGRR